MARSNTELEPLKKTLLKLLPHLTCYRCKTIPSAEFPKRKSFRCLSSHAHLLCEICKMKSACPCGFHVNKVACSLVSSLVDLLPFCCKYRGSGCGKILFQEEMKTHVSRCLFKTVRCINIGCMKRIPFKKFLDHIILPTCSEDPEIKNLVDVFLDDETEHGTFWNPSILRKNPLNKPVFYFFAMVEDEILLAWVYYLGFKEDAERFTYSLEVNKNSKRSVKFTSPVKSIFESPENIIKECDAFMIGLPIARKICERNKTKVLLLNVK